MQWFRAYHSDLDDIALQQLPDWQFKLYWNLTCLASMETTRGTIPYDINAIAFRIRLSPSKTVKGITALIECGLFEVIDGNLLKPQSWDDRQRQSDDVTARVAKHRAKKQETVHETLHVTVPETPPDTDTDTESVSESEPDTETDPESAPAARVGGAYQEEFESFWKDYPRHEPSKAEAFRAWQHATKATPPEVILAGLQRWLPAFANRDLSKVPYATTWLRGQQWTVEQPAVSPRAGPGVQSNDNGHHLADEPDPDYAAWLQVVKDLEQAERTGKSPGMAPTLAIQNAVKALGGLGAIDPANNFHRRDFLKAHKAERLRPKPVEAAP